MAFADSYLQKHRVYPPFVPGPPDPDLGVVVVIPCRKEEGILKALDSLAACREPACSVEVIVVLNSPEQAGAEERTLNRRILLEWPAWEEKLAKPWLRFNLGGVFEFPIRHAGVGMARKTGMDEAAHRFNLLDRPGGVIAGFDADSTCDPNYFLELTKLFDQFPRARGCSIHFEHPLSDPAFDPTLLQSVASYELFLRYFIHAQRWAGFPLAFQTIGSSFAVRAQDYCRVGGMNRQKAGEDFYFLHKIIPLGGFYELAGTTVFPSPRPSDRVPFGTGAAMEKMQRDGETSFKTYNMEAFRLLKGFFDRTDLFFHQPEEGLSGLPGLLEKYLRESDFQTRVNEIRANTSGLESFRKRFFQTFGAFWIMKFLNHHHPNPFARQPAEEAALELLLELNQSTTERTSQGLLAQYRKMDRTAPYLV